MANSFPLPVILNATNGVNPFAAPGQPVAWNVGASGVITNTTDETAFTFGAGALLGTATLPANFFVAGRMLGIKFAGTVPSSNAADTLTLRCRIGGVAGTVLIASAAIDVADNDIFYGDLLLTCRTAGAGGTFSASGLLQGPDAAGVAITTAQTPSAAINTTITQDVVITAEWSVANAANQVRLDQLVIRAD